MKHLIIILSLLISVGCSPMASSDKVIGITPLALEPKEIKGTWVNDEGAILIEVINSEKGLIKIKNPEETKEEESFKIQIMKGESWLYANIMPPSGEKDESIFWGRVILEDQKIIFWFPSTIEFSKAIKSKTILGFIEESKETEKNHTYTKLKKVHLTDTAKNVINLVETNGPQYFEWDEPIFYIKQN